MDYIGDLPEDFDPNESYKIDYNWNFAERDLSDEESPSRLNYEIKRKHPK